MMNKEEMTVSFPSFRLSPESTSPPSPSVCLRVGVKAHPTRDMLDMGFRYLRICP